MSEEKAPYTVNPVYIREVDEFGEWSRLAPNEQQDWTTAMDAIQGDTPDPTIGKPASVRVSDVATDGTLFECMGVQPDDQDATKWYLSFCSDGDETGRYESSMELCVTGPEAALFEQWRFYGGAEIFAMLEEGK